MKLILLILILGLNAQAQGMGVAPAELSMELEKNEITQRKITVFNTGNSTLILEVRTKNLLYDFNFPRSIEAGESGQIIIRVDSSKFAFGTYEDVIYVTANGEPHLHFGVAVKNYINYPNTKANFLVGIIIMGIIVIFGLIVCCIYRLLH